jgi:ribosomal-protein-alanine N-acetyltransferase
MVVASQFKIRTMTAADIPQVVDVERESFPTTWPQTAYKRELANKFARYLVLIDGSRPIPQAELPRPRRSLLGLFRHEEPEEGDVDRIIGYVGMWLMVDQAHIVAIAVRDRYRRQGLGELLLIESVRTALDNQMESITLEVRRSNLGAQALYEKYRFLKVGVRARYYSDNQEDAIIMTTPPVQDGAYLDHFQALKTAYKERWGRDV